MLLAIFLACHPLEECYEMLAFHATPQFIAFTFGDPSGNSEMQTAQKQPLAIPEDARTNTVIDNPCKMTLRQLCMSQGSAQPHGCHQVRPIECHRLCKASDTAAKLATHRLDPAQPPAKPLALLIDGDHVALPIGKCDTLQCCLSMA